MQSYYHYNILYTGHKRADNSSSSVFPPDSQYQCQVLPAEKFFAMTVALAATHTALLQLLDSITGQEANH